MIDLALTILKDEINTYLNLKNGSSEDKLVLTNVAKDDGSWAIPEDKMGLSLIKIEEDRIGKEQQIAHLNNAGKFEYYNPELKFNLFVLVTANFQNGDEEGENNKYTEGLKQLSNVITFLQQKHVFTPENTPSMAESVAENMKLIAEVYYTSFEQQDNLWTVIGAKYLPSILYRVRLIKILEKAPLLQSPFIKEISLELNGWYTVVI